MKKVIIIGAGIAGLSAGSYLQKNGYETEIFEMSSRPGGLCASWKRGDYLIDGCINWFIGCNPDYEAYSVWEGLIDMKDLPFVVFDEFFSFEKDGKVVHCYSDVDKFGKELKAVAPEDGRKISNMMVAIKRFAALNMRSGNVAKGTKFNRLSVFFRKLSFAWFIIVRWRMLSKKYAETVKSAYLKDFFNTFFEGDAPMWMLLANQSHLYLKNAGYPEGGSSEIVDRIVKKYLSLGGNIHYDSKVAKVLVDDNAAKGIVLENGDIFKSDIVISAADGHATVFNMLSGKYQDRTIRRFYCKEDRVPKTSAFYFIFGLKREFERKFKSFEFFCLKKPLLLDGYKFRYLGVTVHNFNSASAPFGKTLLTVHVTSKAPG
ncbi:MAG TPA: FAD-dependent oxidoreductase, partial [Candidatus Omnitrophota bacterium]|nr:FAD-dependent oxidoreductase [Candidatus Omnitrophota bacterium]